MNISKIEQQAFKLVDLWQKSLDERTEQGLVIMPMELEASMLALEKEVKVKQLKLKRSMAGGERKRGGQWKELPLAVEQLRERLKFHGGRLNRLAKELKCDRKTVARRLKGEEKEKLS